LYTTQAAKERQRILPGNGDELGVTPTLEELKECALKGI